MGLLTATRHSQQDPIRRLPTRDLQAEIETMRWLLLDIAPDDASSREFGEMRLNDMVTEVERRERLAAQHAGDPLVPLVPAPDPDLRDRVDRVKQAWPMDRLCRDLLGAFPEPSGGGRLHCSCPLPDHDDTTPSFVVYPDGHAWCFGCQRGGDVIAVAGIVFGFERFYDTLGFLEQCAGIGPGRMAS